MPRDPKTLDAGSIETRSAERSMRSRPPEADFRSAASNGAPSPEVRLLIECARVSRADGDEARVRRIIEGGVSWDEVLLHARWHDLTSRLGDTLHRHAPDLVPGDVLEPLVQRCRATGHRNLFLLTRLFHLLMLFEDRGISAIPFKGSVLAHTVYEDPCLREFSDLDVLVPRSQVRAASALLRSDGFQPRTADQVERRPRVDEWVRYARAHTRPADDVTVDLHWHVAPGTFRAGIDIARLREQTRMYAIGGKPLRSFTPEATLLLHCIHGAKHGPTPWNRLKWTLDVHRLLLTYPDLHWAELSGLADELGCRNILLTGVLLAAGVLGTPVPRALLESARRDPSVPEIVEMSRTSLLDGPKTVAHPPRDIAHSLAVRERGRDRVATFLRHAVLPRPRDWRLVRLPPRLGFLYVPLRLGRLAGKFLVRKLLAPMARSRRRDRERPSDRLRSSHRLLLAGRISLSSLRVWRDLHRRPLPDLVARLDRPGRVRLRVKPRRLGRIVHRVMNLGPFQPRCLTMALVLFRELRRQGTPAELVIGLPSEPKDHRAHAWVEVQGRVVGPPPGRLGHSEMARYGTSPAAAPAASARARETEE